MRAFIVSTCVVAMAWAGLGACPASVVGGTSLPPLALNSIGPTPTLPGTAWIVRGTGFVPAEVATISMRLQGQVDGFAVDVAVTPHRHSDQELRISVVGQLVDVLFGNPPVAGHFTGTLSIDRVAGDGTVDAASLPLDLTLAAELIPQIDSLEPLAWFPGDLLSVAGDGFLHPSEGLSLVQFDGTFTLLSPPQVVPVAGLVVPATTSDIESRQGLVWLLTPDLFGIRPGVFTGGLKVINQHLSGATTESSSLALDAIPLRRPEISGVSPLVVSRGQRVVFEGHGLLPPDSQLQATSLLLLEGTFEPTRGPTVDLTGTNSLALFPDEAEGNTAVTVTVRVDVGVDGRPYGVGLVPGDFVGSVTPMLVFGADSVRGDPFPLSLQIKPAVQMIYVRILPGFDDALEAFGLGEAREAVLARVVEVTARDYEGVNVVFTTEVPSEYAEYGVVEVGGRDPNGTKLFGLDNTAGKDVGNLRFDDVIGGFNAETRARGYAAYGGIFPAEFLQMSPTVGSSANASPRFDEIFGPVSPELGGQAATVEEVDDGGATAPATARPALVAEAIRVFANLVGNTITHEVGHSLGLAAIDGQFHNSGDNPGWVMDAGSFRPFEERGEVDGQGPAVFSPSNRKYLEEVLPVE